MDIHAKDLGFLCAQVGGDREQPATRTEPATARRSKGEPTVRRAGSNRPSATSDGARRDASDREGADLEEPRLEEFELEEPELEEPEPEEPEPEKSGHSMRGRQRRSLQPKSRQPESLRRTLSTKARVPTSPARVGTQDHLISTALVSLPQEVVHNSARAAELRGQSLESFVEVTLSEALSSQLEQGQKQLGSSPYRSEVEALFRTGRLVYVQGYPPPL